MASPLPPAMAPARTGLARMNASMTLLIAALVVVALLTWSGLRSARAASARRSELSRVRTELAGFEDLSRRYAPAVAAESLSWRQTWGRLRELGVFGDDRLGTTRAVSRIAEEAGLVDVRVLLGPSDTTGAEARLSTEGIRRKPAPFGVVVEARGGMRAVSDFLDRLPPSVAPTGLVLLRQDGRGRHRISLAVYELEFTHGTPPPSAAANGRPSLEHAAAGRRDGRRAGD